MKKILLAASILLTATAASAFADAPAYRTSASATGKNPTVTISADAGDAILVFAMSGGHSINDLNAYSISDDDSGLYSDVYCPSTWQQGAKYTQLQAHIRSALTGAGTLHIAVDMGGSTGVAVAVAVSGLTSVDWHPPVNGCGSLNQWGGSVRQVKANSISYAFSADETPTVPKNGQTNAFLGTSMTLAVVVNEQSPPSPTAPSGWTQRAAQGITAQGKTFGMSISTRDSGFSGSTVTWGSTTPTAGNGMVVELRPLN